MRRPHVRRLVAALAGGVAMAGASVAAAAPIVDLPAGRLWTDGFAAPSRGTWGQKASHLLAHDGRLAPQLGPGDWIVERVAALPDGGHSVRLRQHMRVSPVLGHDAVVRFDAAGRVRWVRSSLGPLGPVAEAPALSSAQAIASAWARVGTSPPPAAPAPRVTLAIHAPPRLPPRLAYVVRLPLVRGQAFEVVVDAVTGEALGARDRVLHAGRAQVFAENPVVSPLGEVTLPVAPGAAVLANDDTVAETCVDHLTCPDSKVHGCEFEPTALADAAGDFLAYGRPSTDTDPLDPFAEVQAFFHVNKGLATFRTIDPELALDGTPVVLIANMRFADDCDAEAHKCSGDVFDGGSGLGPFDNAFFSEKGSLFEDQAVLVFGQGTEGDFAYDGDVAYHELGHAAVFAKTDLHSLSLDDRGLDATLGGLHEGYADYLSSVVTGDPDLGEYTGKLLGRDGPIRSLLNTKTCPADHWGESHQDSEPWSASLWAVRAALPEASRASYDAAVYDAMASLGDYDGFTMAAALTVEEVRTMLGDAAATAMADSFAKRGIDGCGGRVLELGPGDEEPRLFLAPPWWVGLDVTPPPLQLAVPAPAPASAVRVSIGAFKVLAGGCDADAPPPEFEVWIKPAAPLSFAYDDSGPGKGRRTVSDDLARGSVVPAADGSASALVSATLPPGPVFVALMNRGERVTVANLAVSFELVGADAAPEPPPEPAAEPVPEPAVDAGAKPDAGDAGDGGADGQGHDERCGSLPCRSGGCGCAIPERATAPASALSLLALAAIGRMRRRARSRAP